MLLKKLTLTNFRNYARAAISFHDGIHIIFGENGAGKTSILEAIHYLALTKSFRTTVDKNLILNNASHKEKMFRIHGEFKSADGQALTTAIAYDSDIGKQLTVNGQKIPRFSEYIGEVPTVLLHPADLSLTQGGPAQRRRFLDILLSQSDRLYLHNLIQYNRSLRQRNRILQESAVDPQLLGAWEDNLISAGVGLITQRRETTTVISESVSAYYRELSNKDDMVTVDYRTNVDITSEKGISGPDQAAAATKDALGNAYRRLFEQKRRREIAHGTTLVGPHRDDLALTINGRPVRDVASQGEHKTLVIALKLAEFKFLREQRMQAPILLFDDIFGELDAHRIRQMLQQLSTIGQVFVTTTSESFFDKVQTFDQPTHYYRVEQGQVTAVQN